MARQLGLTHCLFGSLIPRLRHRQLGPLSGSRVTFFRSSAKPVFASGESRFTLGREFGVGSNEASGLITQGRRGVEVKGQENEEGGPQVDDEKPFYAALEFWIQVAVVILTFGFVDAG